MISISRSHTCASILGVIGLTQIEFIYAEHQSSDPEAAAQSVARAESALAALAG